LYVRRIIKLILCISEALEGAIVGACLTFLFTSLVELRKQHCGKTRVILLNSSYTLNREGNTLDSIDIYANIECMNTKLIPASIYDWHAEITTDRGIYRVQMSNEKISNGYGFMDVAYMNQNQSCILPLHGRKYVNIKHFEIEQGIKDITSINHIDIFYRCNGSKEKKAEDRR
jgi:hypothetical protein